MENGEDNCNTCTGDSTPPKKKTRFRNCTFKENWLKAAEFKDWLAKCDDKTNVCCTICQCVLTVKYDGVDAVRHHSNGKKHQTTAQNTKDNICITHFYSSKNSKTEDAVTATELTYVFHGVKTSLQLSMDCGSKLATHLHSDSSLASKMKLGRTKIESLVENVLGPFSVKSAVEKLKASSSPFAVATDASNKGNRKFFPLAAHFFYVESGVNDVLLDFYEEPDESSESVMKCIIDAVNNLGLDLKDVIAYRADSASVNYGKNCSVFVKLKAVQPQIIQANCNCHVLHNAAKNCMKALSFDVERLVLKVFNEFSCSAKKVKRLKSCFDFVQQEYSKVLSHVPTRWLSLFAQLKGFFFFFFL
ncbi:uncharacterized protein LOC102355222 [Latimeria chalumnae]|uniref:uncharacterized protein LOC102355222 n=1 Tax=Latimeria chalumnae TaxID=7897 RepID=UPI00313EC71C